MHGLVFRLIGTLVLGAACQQASAVEILGSYPVRTEGSSFAFSATKWEAIGFRMGNVGNYSLDTVTMRLSGSVAGEVSVALYDTVVRSRPCGWSIDAGTMYCDYKAPGTAIADLSNEVVHAKADYEFQARGVVPLKQDTLYWIVFKPTEAKTFRYYEHAYSDVPYTGNPGHGLSPWQGLYRSEAGVTPVDFAFSPGYDNFYGPGDIAPGVLGQDWSSHSGLNILRVTGSLLAVPEPSTPAMFFLGGLGLLMFRRRPKRCFEVKGAS